MNQQGVLSLGMIMRNNEELMRGVNRAVDVTVSALQVAVTAALALANQKIVLDKVNALNQTTSDLISGTAERLRNQGAEIQKQAATSMLSLESLKSAFANINAAMDEIPAYRQEALPQHGPDDPGARPAVGPGRGGVQRSRPANRARPSCPSTPRDRVVDIAQRMPRNQPICLVNVQGTFHPDSGRDPRRGRALLVLAPRRPGSLDFGPPAELTHEKAAAPQTNGR